MKIKTLHSLALTGCLLPSLACAMSGEPEPTPTPIPAPNSQVSIIAIGDMGTGKEAQYEVSRAIEAVCAEKACDFAIGLGDNIYEVGIDSAQDQQMLTKFEYPYENLDFPFYMALGNHDNSSVSGIGLNNNKGEHQVDYHYQADRYSDKWNMPARYYRFAAPLESEAKLVDLFALDSNPLAALSDLNPEYYQIPYKKKQQKWFEDQLQTSQTPWRIAFAHHPYASNGLHGDAGLYDRVPLLGIVWHNFLEQSVCDNVDLIITGHDHDLQYLKPRKNCGKTEFIISGAGAKTREFRDENRNESYWQQDNIKGFFRLDFIGNKLTIEAYTVEADQLTLAYTRTIEK
ncbi:acid phosphatase [Bermanella marisrubri]|uniref:Calcineurin-like phosphoesterase domain-containing protein n=1 Tax=Bermanella marisrubri TaxID=207949 RepID=Q1N3E8_9GAMM|nr:metallophosphoesterase [Bermanella marisrubri]EAT12643.1 hypothetical protein RED65_13202 [Oceanobacter sp. RED65] [Bermanella marisrubri]QIZ85232.1 acid phosphatase [Bermanella marisrubri]